VALWLALRVWALRVCALLVALRMLALLVATSGCVLQAKHMFDIGDEACSLTAIVCDFVIGSCQFASRGS
jgi:hypothetical protein